jgi:hypothetical protein
MIAFIVSHFLFGQAKIYGPGVNRPSVWCFFITIILLADNFCGSRESSCFIIVEVQGADNSLDRPGRKQATATEDFEFHIFYL